MNKLTFSILIGVFLFFNSIGHSADFDPEKHWREMHYQAQSRADWFKDKIQELSNEGRPLEERAVLAKKIFPNLNENDIFFNSGARNGIRTASLNRLKFDYIVKATLSDLMYSSLFWNFLERTIEHYWHIHDSELIKRKQVLPHLALELKSFDCFAYGDLTNKDNAQTRYMREEFCINRAIYEECTLLSQFYGVEITTLNKIVDKKTNQELGNQIILSENTTFSGSGKSQQASETEPYYMEQIIAYRNLVYSTSAQRVILPNLNDPKIILFQNYILPASDTTLIMDLKQCNKPAEKSPKKENVQATKTPSTNKAKTSRKRAKTNISQRRDSAQPKEGKNNDSPPPPPQKIDGISEPIAEVKAVETPTLNVNPTPVNPTPIEASTLPTPLPPLPVQVPVRNIVFNNIREITFHKEFRTSRDYEFGDKVYSIPFFNASLANFGVEFLTEIKKKTHLSPKTEKLPNIAQCCLIFHYEVKGNNKRDILTIDNLYLSGGKFFGKQDMDFKRTHNLMNAMHDILDKEEKKYITSLPMDKKGIPLGMTIEKKLRNEIIWGPWKNNCVDSEAICLLDLNKRMPYILRGLVARNNFSPIKIIGMVLGMSSYRDCCSNCHHLVQGYQWTLHNSILNLSIPEIEVDDNFGTLAMTSGHIRCQQDSWSNTQPRKGLASLTGGQHNFVYTKL